MEIHGSFHGKCFYANFCVLLLERSRPPLRTRVLMIARAIGRRVGVGRLQAADWFLVGLDFQF